MDSNETNKRIEELQVLEGQLQNFLAQKQTVQIEINEIENALNELKSSGDEVYKVVSGIMLRSSKEKLNKELKEKKKMLESKVDSFEKQEKILGKNAKTLRDELSSKINQKN